jgi:Asp-tRNA(Asn)/Glu-tRNA(Gln) amidotransferase A subunit family amidase
LQWVDVIVCPPMPTTTFPHDHSPWRTQQLDVDGKKRYYSDQVVWVAIATSNDLPTTVVPIGKDDHGLLTRWKINRDEARKLAAEAAPLLKKQGASSVRVGFCHSGQHTGQTMVVVNYPDWQAYGKAMEAQAQDTAYQGLFAQVLKSGELLDRAVLVMQDL